MTIRSIAGVGALLLTLTACGGNDDAAAKEAISQQLQSNSVGDFSLTKADADCIANGMVDDIGVDQLREYGLVTEDNKADKAPDEVTMSEKDADAAAGVFVGCIDAGQLITDSMGDTVPAEMVDCIDGALTDDLLTQLFSSVFQGKDAQQVSQELLTEPLTSCLTAG